jgi:hypothetical protein
MTENEDRNRGRGDDDAAGGAEGGMASGSAGGPSQADLEGSDDKAGGFGEKTPGTDVGAKVGDLGKGSHEQTQGGTDPGGDS